MHAEDLGRRGDVALGPGLILEVDPARGVFETKCPRDVGPGEPLATVVRHRDHLHPRQGPIAAFDQGPVDRRADRGQHDRRQVERPGTGRGGDRLGPGVPELDVPVGGPDDLEVTFPGMTNASNRPSGPEVTWSPWR